MDHKDYKKRLIKTKITSVIKQYHHINTCCLYGKDLQTKDQKQVANTEINCHPVVDQKSKVMNLPQY